jgi:hypothetical protein
MIFGSYIVNYTNDYSGKAVQKKPELLIGVQVLYYWHFGYQFN